MWNDSTSYNNSGIELSCKIICLSLKKLLFAIATETLNALMAKTHQNSCGSKQFKDSLEFILSLITTDLMVHSFGTSCRMAKECKAKYI